ncbi:hypothetical protein F4811DRAFT_551938 [Daldinia bambusicola]|nr:hypothetical protein F4811DRAFT_551938 [Daldinia bambusicola]
MPAVRSTSEGNRRREPWSASRSPLQNPEGVKRQRQADHIERLARAHRDAPNGTRIGLYWNYVKEKNMAYIKDHFSGAIRPAIMKDDMYSNMSEEELEWHRQWYLRMKEQAKAEQAAEAQKEDENKGDASKETSEKP